MDQVWRAMWLSFLSIKFSSQRSTFSGLFLNVKYVKKVGKGFLDTAVATNKRQRRVKLIYDMTSDCLQQFTFSSDWNQKEKTQQSFVVQEVV